MIVSPDEPQRLGDYLLIEQILESAQTRRWQAEQVSVGRKVLVDELKPELLDQRQAFLAEARARAAMHHPLVASVYEAVSEDGHCFFAHEQLPGKPLSARVVARSAMKPAELAQILRKVAEVQMHYQHQQKSSSPLGLENIVIDEHGVMRLENLAREGERRDDEAFRDMSYLGHAALPLVADGQPGATRLLTLLGWMRGDQLERHLEWQEVIELCEQIEKQLTDPLLTQPLSSSDGSSSGSNLLVWISIAVAFALASVVAVMVAMKTGSEPKVTRISRVPLPEPVLITPSAESGSPYRMAAHEVTIGQYAQFLSVLETLQAGVGNHGQSGSQHKVFDHREQPASKVSHVPDDWDALLAAAKSGKPWKGKRISLDAPVVGVDWWDAMAYAEWKRGRLPTYEEWLQALGVPPDQISTIACSDWGAVNPETADRSKHGVLNMCGAVSEWLLRPMASPTNPLGDKKWILVGGSYLQPGSHALTREWVDDRGLRREDLGFRVVFDAK